MRSSGKCPDHWSSAMPPPRIQSDPSRGQPGDGDHGVSLSPGPPPSFFVPQSPPARPASKRTQMRTKWLLYNYLYQILLYCTEWGLCPHLLPFLLPPTSHPCKMLGRVKSPSLHALLPTSTNLLFFLFWEGKKKDNSRLLIRNNASKKTVE